MPERQPQASENPTVSWGPDPEIAHRPWVPILRPALGQPVRVVLISNIIEEVALHWIDGRSVPHTRPSETCASCLSGSRPRSYHYGLGWGVYRGRECICLVEISADAFWGCEALKGADLNGLPLELTRHGHTRGHVTARVGSVRKTVPHMALPSIREALQAVWAGLGKPLCPPRRLTSDTDQIPL
jgi:hypothetical protein